MTYLAECHEDDAPRILDWITNRGGVQVWGSLDLSDPGLTSLTPVRDADGNPVHKPHWKYSNAPRHIITDPAQVGVYTEVLFKAFPVSLRHGSQGLTLKLTDAAQRRVNKVTAQCEDKHGNAHIRKGVLPDAMASIGVFYTPGELRSLSCSK